MSGEESEKDNFVRTLLAQAKAEDDAELVALLTGVIVRMRRAASVTSDQIAASVVEALGVQRMSYGLGHPLFAIECLERRRVIPDRRWEGVTTTDPVTEQEIGRMK